MSLLRTVVPVVAGLLVALQSPHAKAADLNVIAGGGIAGALKEIAAQFEAASGHKLNIRYGTTPELIKLANTGDSFDVGIVPREVLGDAAARSKFAGGEIPDVARAGLGVAVRAGAAKPDIRTVDAFKQALLGAKSIASLPESAAGTQVIKVFERLGLGEPLKVKLQAKKTTGEVVKAVAEGEAELGVFLLSVLTAPGLDIVGPFPADVQQEVIYAGAIAMEPADPGAARALIDFMRSEAAIKVLEAKGLSRG